MKKPLIITLVLLVLAGASWAGYDRFAPVPNAKRAVSAILLDADSAKFANVRYVSEAKAVCGRVNAKNTMGGYIGFKPFIVEGEEVFIADGTVIPNPGEISEWEAQRLDPMQFSRLHEEHQKKVDAYETHMGWLMKVATICDEQV